MKVAITDANIFIDLHSLEILDYLFLLRLEIHTTVDVMDELDDEQVHILKKREENGDLYVYSMNSDEIEEVSNMSLSNALSTTDKSIFYYSMKLGCLVLTGDKKLRKTIEDSGCEVHGIVWIFDQWVGGSIISKEDAADMLLALIKENPFLPIAECQERIDKWQN